MEDKNKKDPEQKTAPIPVLSKIHIVNGRMIALAERVVDTPV
ncbi:hypothetical protein BpJC7_31990 [Weizmannia acidilactici]|uniref:Uncharacterized protein n=1 Tax=Weizmannia acidilactici TaxID=2607726 RepID=A0A5J4JAY5_9BACI|nr:hypothetical protein [Weizmannia acidilactici]GER68622.1 hypothetical protein BpJC4_30930 [Weizmannia acidilactici]GER71896.1 hypothetical protein BpJC7_31990 [Weizmannia acidilactici]GER75153.1 hypothetical protein BpPP18_32200 [Weizmannia acidilactici]